MKAYCWIFDGEKLKLLHLPHLKCMSNGKYGIFASSFGGYRLFGFIHLEDIGGHLENWRVVFFIE